MTDDELRHVFARAEEIQREASHRDDMKAELEAVVGAAEEVGFTRNAIERALREHLNLPASPPVVGALAFARSADGKSYVAEVLATSPHGVRVRFLGGSEHMVTLDHIRPCSFIPGARVAVNWPWWGPWTCNVVSFDAHKQRVTLNDGWGSTKTFPISEVWLDPPRKPHARSGRARIYATLLGAGAGIGALVGSIITALLTS
jgi:hypothetical protein